MCKKLSMLIACDVWPCISKQHRIDYRVLSPRARAGENYDISVLPTLQNKKTYTLKLSPLLTCYTAHLTAKSNLSTLDKAAHRKVAAVELPLVLPFHTHFSRSPFSTLHAFPSHFLLLGNLFPETSSPKFRCLFAKLLQDTKLFCCCVYVSIFFISLRPKSKAEKNHENHSTPHCEVEYVGQLLWMSCLNLNKIPILSFDLGSRLRYFHCRLFFMCAEKTSFLIFLSILCRWWTKQGSNLFQHLCRTQFSSKATAKTICCWI